MFLLISHEADQSCSEVLEWMSEQPVYRWNTDTELLPHWAWPWPRALPHLQGIWFRKLMLPPRSALAPALQQHQVSEWQSIRQDFLQQLQAPRCLGDARFEALPKLQQLRMAERCGFRVPAYGIFQRKTLLLQFAQKHSALALKALSGQLQTSSKGLYTQRLSRSDIEAWPDSFSPVFIQAYLLKRYELRVFFLDGQCFCLGIESQQQAESRIDFRRKAAQLNMQPYRLSPEIVKQLSTLFAELQLNCGSVDLVRAEDGTLYFLEINPVGQFGFFKQGLFQLEKRIAYWLMNRPFS